MMDNFRRRFWISLILTLPVLILSPMLRSFFQLESVLAFPGDRMALLVLSTLLFGYGGYPFLKGMVNELRSALPGMMTLIALAISVAFFYSAAVVLGLEGRLFFWELATLIDVMLLGHWIEMRSVMGASRAVESLAQLMPSEALLVHENGDTETVSVENLSSGDRVRIKPGEHIPADGRVIEGETFVNESMISGESTPVHKTRDERVVGGSINGDGSIDIEVEKTGDDSFLSQVIRMVEEAQQSKSQTQTLADRAAFWLTLIALGAGLVTFLVWFVWVQRAFDFALSRTVTVMVITCPHALGLAIPLVAAVSTARSAANGLLIRNRSAFEQARNLEAIIFDKTGTLTEGKFEVTDTLSLAEDIDTDEILRMAASVESRSEHPLAQAIVEAADETPEVENFESIPGKGARGIVQNTRVSVVSPGYLQENDLDVSDSRVSERQQAGKTVVFVLFDDQPVGAIAMGDRIRKESKTAIDRLRKMGIRTVMLTGDSERVAQSVAKEIGIDEVYAGILPDQKAETVKQVQSDSGVVAMAGDGVNDAPALAQADVGIAIGAGTDVAAETADIILVRSNPLDVVASVKLSRATYKKMIQNLVWATGYNAVAIPLAAGVLFSYGILLSPAVGAILMSLSTVIVAINARFLHVES
jgi:Cu2+-exporting ATPase